MQTGAGTTVQTGGGATVQVPGNGHKQLHPAMLHSIDTYRLRTSVGLRVTACCIRRHGLLAGTCLPQRGLRAGQCLL